MRKLIVTLIILTGVVYFCYPVNSDNGAKINPGVQTQYQLSEIQAVTENIASSYSSENGGVKQKGIWVIISIAMTALSYILIIVFLILYIKQRRAKKALESTAEIVASQKKELEILNATKDKLLSIIGHDLRTSVGASKSMLFQLVKDPDVFLPEEQEQIRGELFRLSEDTYDLLENLLSWAKNQREFKLSKDLSSIKKLVDSNIEQQQYFAAKKNISLMSQLLEGYFVKCDRNMIDLVIRNIISNAIKFTPVNGSITISGQKVDKFFKLSVKDSGVGIPPENISRILDSGEFFTTYGTNSEKGSGLGLLLCKEFVEKNGGSISIESIPGNGTTVSFTIEIGKEINNPTVIKMPSLSGTHTIKKNIPSAH